MAIHSSRSQILRWRSFVLVGCCLTLVWLWLHKANSYTFQKTVIYHEEGVLLPTYGAPFSCNQSALPARTRLTKVKGENYVVLGHGFPDMITDKFWINNGREPWEKDLTHQMNYFIDAIKGFEPSRNTFMDLGANIGTHALYMVSKGHNVHIFEPTYANHVLMQCSLAMSGVQDRVRLNTFGLGDKAFSVCMKSTSNNFGDSRVDRTAQSCEPEQQANVGTIDHYYRTFMKGQKVAVFKIDIQGFEVAALQHATELFDSDDAPVAVFFEFDPGMIKGQGFDPQDLVAYFWERDYAIWREDVLAPLEQRDIDQFSREAMTSGGIDLFAVKKSWRKKMDEAGFVFYGGEIRPQKLPTAAAATTAGNENQGAHKEARNGEVS